MHTYLQQLWLLNLSLMLVSAEWTSHPPLFSPLAHKPQSQPSSTPPPTTPSSFAAKWCRQNQHQAACHRKQGAVLRTLCHISASPSCAIHIVIQQMCVRHASHHKTTFKLKTTGFAQGYSDCSFILVFRLCKLLIHVSILIQQTVQSCSNSTQTIQNFCLLLAGGQSISLKCDNFYFYFFASFMWWKMDHQMAEDQFFASC